MGQSRWNRRGRVFSAAVVGSLGVGACALPAMDESTSTEELALTGGAAGAAGSGTAGAAGSAAGSGSSTGGVGGSTGGTSTGGIGGGGKGGSGGSVGKGGSGGSGGGVGILLGHWQFDDCRNGSLVLDDSSGNGFEAARSSSTTCAEGPGDDGSGVRDAILFNEAADVVTVGNEPVFDLDQNLFVSAWVHPNNVAQPHTIVQKAGSQNQSFRLGINNKRVEFTVNLRNGQTVTSSAPIKAGQWSHVAGLFDGQFIFLFLDGQRVGQVSARGRLRNVNGPLRIGNNVGGTEFFRGRIDEVRFSSEPLSEFDVRFFSCLNRPPVLASVLPATSGLVPPETPVDYEVAVTNRSFGAACSDGDFVLSPQFVPSGFEIRSDGEILVPPGGTGVLPVTVTGGFDADPGRHDLPFTVFDFSSGGTVDGNLVYELAEPSGCFVRTTRELMLTDLSIVEDPSRTAGGGVWSFGGLMRAMAPTPEEAPAMVQALFDTWRTDQTVNGFTVPARPAIGPALLDAWPRTPAGELDLDQAPLTLNAIVNRVDIRSLSNGNAGEGRFVFGVNFPGSPFPQQFTVILEYRLPAANETDILGWANAWHALGSLPFPSPEYNAALQDITDRFSGRNAEPGRVNGSALGQLRTNEIALEGRWELREFTLSPSSLFLEPATVKLTPDNAFNFTSTVSNFVNQNEAAILLEQHVVPEQFEGSPFLGGSSFNDLVPWFGDGTIANNDARHKFSLNTCNGCHGPEANTAFLQIAPRFPGETAFLSPFLTGTVASDPVTGEARPLNDLRRRRSDLESLVCAPAVAGVNRMAAEPTGTTVAEGIKRVH
jgi:hypothetical protein